MRLALRFPFFRLDDDPAFPLAVLVIHDCPAEGEGWPSLECDAGGGNGVEDPEPGLRERASAPMDSTSVRFVRSFLKSPYNSFPQHGCSISAHNLWRSEWDTKLTHSQVSLVVFGEGLGRHSRVVVILNQ